MELKLSIDTLNKWFSSIIKPKYFEIDWIKKQVYRKENTIDQQKTICGFLLDIDNGGWIDFVVECEYLFLRNICSFDELKK